MRAAVGERFVVGCRFLAEECIAGGNTEADAAWFGAEFARAGMDYLSLSRGGKFEDAKQPRIGWARYPYTGPSGYECMPTVRSDERGPFGRNRGGDSRRARRGARRRMPRRRSSCLAASRPSSRRRSCSAPARPTSSPPRGRAWRTPTGSASCRLGSGDEVRRCVFTNYCEGLDQVHKPVTCKLWDHAEAATSAGSAARRRRPASAGRPGVGAGRDQ